MCVGDIFHEWKEAMSLFKVLLQSVVCVCVSEAKSVHLCNVSMTIVSTVH